MAHLREIENVTQWNSSIRVPHDGAELHQTAATSITASEDRMSCLGYIDIDGKESSPQQVWQASESEWVPFLAHLGSQILDGTV